MTSPPGGRGDCLESCCVPCDRYTRVGDMDARPDTGAYHRPIASDPAAPEGRALPPIRLFLADVDGTLVTHDKVLTDDAVAAVRRLRQAGVLFAVPAADHPAGWRCSSTPSTSTRPIAAFNGGLMVDRDLQVMEQHVLPEDLVVPVADHMKSFDLDVWLYRGADWYVPDPKAPHVDREAWTVKFEPKVMEARRAHRRRRQAGRRERRPRRHRQRPPTPRRSSSATTSRRRPPSPTTSTSRTRRPTRARSPSTWPSATSSTRARSPPSATCPTTS